MEKCKQKWKLSTQKNANGIIAKEKNNAKFKCKQSEIYQDFLTGADWENEWILYVTYICVTTKFHENH